MEAALVTGAALLGLAGLPHCAAMCGAPCAALTGPRHGGVVAFQLARLLGYAAAGALAAASVAALADLGRWSPALRPLWSLLHMGALALGLWMLWQGRQPAWMQRIGRPAPARAAGEAVRRGPPGADLEGDSGGWRRGAAAGLLWFAWPCGLLHSALMAASMARGAAGGATVMAAFALASSPALLVAPWAWRRLRQGRDRLRIERWLVRGAGALLVAASVWALGAGLWQRALAWCLGG